MNAVMVGTPGKRARVENEQEPEGMSSVEVERLVELLIESGRAAVPTADPERTKRVWERVLAALERPRAAEQVGST